MFIMKWQDLGSRPDDARWKAFLENGLEREGFDPGCSQCSHGDRK